MLNSKKNKFYQNLKKKLIQLKVNFFLIKKIKNFKYNVFIANTNEKKNFKFKAIITNVNIINKNCFIFI